MIKTWWTIRAYSHLWIIVAGPNCLHSFPSYWLNGCLKSKELTFSEDIWNMQFCKVYFFYMNEDMNEPYMSETAPFMHSWFISWSVSQVLPVKSLNMCTLLLNWYVWSSSLWRMVFCRCPSLSFLHGICIFNYKYHFLLAL